MNSYFVVTVLEDAEDRPTQKSSTCRTFQGGQCSGVVRSPSSSVVLGRTPQLVPSRLPLSPGIWPNVLMASIWSFARSSLRGRLRSALAMAFVIALAGGVSLAALSGARRTDSAIGRFVTYFRPAQGQIEAPSKDFAAISRLPEVAATEAGAFMLLVPLDRKGRVDHSYEISTVALLDHLDFSRPLVVAGRLSRANQMNEVVVNPSAQILSPTNRKLPNRRRLMNCRPVNLVHAVQRRHDDERRRASVSRMLGHARQDGATIGRRAPWRSPVGTLAVVGPLRDLPAFAAWCQS